MMRGYAASKQQQSYHESVQNSASLKFPASSLSLSLRKLILTVCMTHWETNILYSYVLFRSSTVNALVDCCTLEPSFGTTNKCRRTVQNTKIEETGENKVLSADHCCCGYNQHYVLYCCVAGSRHTQQTRTLHLIPCRTNGQPAQPRFTRLSQPRVLYLSISSNHAFRVGTTQC